MRGKPPPEWLLARFMSAVSSADRLVDTINNICKLRACSCCAACVACRGVCVVLQHPWPYLSVPPSMRDFVIGMRIAPPLHHTTAGASMISGGFNLSFSSLNLATMHACGISQDEFPDAAEGLVLEPPYLVHTTYRYIIPGGVLIYTRVGQVGSRV